LSQLLSTLLVQTAIWTGLFALGTAIEFIAAIDRSAIRRRLPGLAFNYISVFGSIIIAWPLQQLWKHLGLASHIVIPLADWLAPLGTAGSVAYVAILVIVTDFFRYWCHRAEHHRWLWPYHAVHHAQTELHVSNSSGHPLQVVPDFLLVSLPLSLFQFSGPGLPFLISALVGLMTLYIHSPIEIHAGPLRRLIVDNRFHRIHHSIEERHFDRNFGIGLSLWDAMFGTAYWPGSDEWPATGVAGLDPPRSIGAFLAFPFKRIGEATRPVSAGRKAATCGPFLRQLPGQPRC